MIGVKSGKLVVVAGAGGVFRNLSPYDRPKPALYPKLADKRSKEQRRRAGMIG
jgi:hypothetical protein